MNKASIQPPPPDADNILRAFEVNFSIVPSAAATDEQKAIALCWLFHLVGDALLVHLALVIVLVGGRRNVGFGSTMGYGGASVMISVGPGARPEHLGSDWVLTHEMSHLALPNLDREHRWLEEGMATYVELVARARSGALAAPQLWRDLWNGPVAHGAQLLAPGRAGQDQARAPAAVVCV